MAKRRSTSPQFASQALQQAKSGHPWPTTVAQFGDAERQARADLFWADFQRSRPHEDWAISDLVLLAEACRLSVLIGEAHADLEEQGLYAYSDKGNRSRSPALDVLSMLQSHRAQLIGKLRLATPAADARVPAAKAKAASKVAADMEAAMADDDLIARPN